MKNTISWTAGNGSVITVTISEESEKVTVAATVAGEPMKNWGVAVLPEPMAVGDKMVVAMIGKIGLVDTRYADVMQMIAAAQAKIDSRPKSLTTQREILAKKLGILRMDEYDAGSVLMRSDRGDGTALKAIRRELAKAKAALADFDATNPDVVAEIKADKKSAVARFLAVD